jgi:Spy/CpxP family protein refolding chaperone
MFGFVIGTLCLIGLIKTLRRGYGYGCGYGYGRGYGYGPGGGCGYGHGHGHHGCGGHHEGGWDRGHGGPFRTHGRGWGGPFARGGMPDFFLRGLFQQLDTTPGQEKAIRAAFEELREAMAGFRGEMGKTRTDIGRAMRGASFDETVMGELFARHDTAMEAMRKAMVGALAKVHEVLDERQRERLADLIERSPGFWGGFGGRGVEI